MVRRTTAMPDTLTRLWTKQLYREYAHILHWYGLKNALAPVALAIAPITNYGEWRPATRTIVMADHLIRDYPWNVVLEVLKHEMAHQYVHRRDTMLVRWFHQRAAVGKLLFHHSQAITMEEKAHDHPSDSQRAGAPNRG